MTNSTLKVSLLSTAFFALSAVSGFAQNTGRISVKVPFEFTAGSVTLPAGEYNFQENNLGVLFISSQGQGKSFMVLTSPEGSAKALDQTSVKFDKVNGTYALTEIDIFGEPSRRLVKLDSTTDRRAAISARVGIGNSSSKSLKQ